MNRRGFVASLVAVLATPFLPKPKLAFRRDAFEQAMRPLTQPPALWPDQVSGTKWFYVGRAAVHDHRCALPFAPCDCGADERTGIRTHFMSPNGSEIRT